VERATQLPSDQKKETSFDEQDDEIGQESAALDVAEPVNRDETVGSRV
jgi:hypothetical protein